jgi:lysophospholipase L1-like esterase
MNFNIVYVLFLLALVLVFIAIAAKSFKKMPFLKVKVTEGLTGNSNNIVLIGDSMLNNFNYVQQSIPEILKLKTPNVFNFAADGSTIADCYTQLDKIPIKLNTQNTYVFISAGGNDILNARGQLDNGAINTLFTKYITLIKSIKAKLPNVKINILNLYLPTNPQYQSYTTSIQLWNELIKTNSSKVGEMYSIIDTNKLLTTATDFVYDIEPSETGGEKIATAIYLMVI